MTEESNVNVQAEVVAVETGVAEPGKLAPESADEVGNSAAALDDDDAAPDGEKPVEPTWREDWRERFAGKDEKLLSRLKRFASPENVFRSYLELEKKLATGGTKATLPDNPSPEDLAAYRKANNIPEAPDGYVFEAPGAIALSEADKEEIDHFREAFHKLNLPADAAKGLLDTYFARRLEIEADLADAAREATATYRAELKAEYGRDYERNINIGKSWLDTMVGSEARNEMAGLLLADGTRLGDNPAFTRMIVQAGLAGAGDDTLAEAEFSGSGKSIEEQYREALDLRFTDSGAYNSAEHQAKLMKLAGALNAAASRR